MDSRRIQTRMMIGILIVTIILIAAILAFAATKPNTFRLQRSVIINASPEKVFPFINDFHNWPHWGPQDKEDPSMIRSYAGSADGVGALCDWDSKGSAGKGRMKILDSVPPGKISIQVDFEKPFKAHNLNQFTLEQIGETTKVTWAMQGSNLYIVKLMSIFVNMDKVAGKHFESGLENLRTVAAQ
jgi:uncharacterized protein YndB with AHSA1/START domain